MQKTMVLAIIFLFFVHLSLLEKDIDYWNYEPTRLRSWPQQVLVVQKRFRGLPYMAQRARLCGDYMAQQTDQRIGYSTAPKLTAGEIWSLLYDQLSDGQNGKKGLLRFGLN